MSRSFLVIVLLGFFTVHSSAQEFGYGFKAGLSFNSFISDSETDDAGNALEEFTNSTGFHVGVTVAWKATELMGVRGELMYSQKGGRRKFEGPSYLILEPTAGNPIQSTGNRKTELNISISSIELPVTGYAKIFPWLEIHAGASLGFLVSSPVFGDFKYTNGRTPSGTAVAEIDYEIDGNYASDDPGEALFTDPPTTVKAGASDIIVPLQAGPYYEFKEDRGNLFKVMEIGAVGGLSIYLNKGLYISGRVNYGITDITKSKADVSLVNLDSNGNFITRDDDDRNFSIQTSIGFAF